MTVTLLIHLEKASPGHFTWWAESPDVPGFSASADSLLDLEDRSRRAIAAILEEQGQPVDDLVVVSHLSRSPDANGPTASGTPAVRDLTPVG